MALLIGAFCSDVGHFMCVSRTFGFLPFYVIGMKLSREDVARVEKLPKIPVFISFLRRCSCRKGRETPT